MWHCELWHGKTEHGLARRGTLWPGKADLSTEPYGALCWVLRNSDVAKRDKARRGKPRSGLEARGGARRGKAPLISARRVNRLSLLDSINPDMARQGWLRLGSAWQGPAIHGGVWQGGARTADGSTELLRRLPAVFFESRHGLVRLSADRTGWQWCGGVW
jgi:hypothetical protein